MVSSHFRLISDYLEYKAQYESEWMTLVMILTRQKLRDKLFQNHKFSFKLNGGYLCNDENESDCTVHI